MDEERRKQRIAIEENAVRELRTHMQIEDEDKQRTRKWHVGKEIPLAMVGAIFLQTVGVVWGAATLNAKVENNEKAANTATVVQATVDRRQDEEARRSEDRILGALEKLSSKVDRVLEGKGK